MIITGIGSRKIDQRAFNDIYTIAGRLAKLGWVLRSGGAVGADTAWELGWGSRSTREIYLPNIGFNGRPKNDACYLTPFEYDVWVDAIDIASKLHPRFESIDDFARDAHTRNVFQVLGRDLNTPSDVLVAHAPPLGKSVSGGTSTAYNLARAKGIPTYNLAVEQQRQDFFDFVLKSLGGDCVKTFKRHSAPNDLTSFME